MKKNWRCSKKKLAEAQAVCQEQNKTLDYLIGTMIELPRAALTADEIAAHAAFFSFGTNDLTQTTFGLFSRRRQQLSSRLR